MNYAIIISGSLLFISVAILAHFQDFNEYEYRRHWECTNKTEKHIQDHIKSVYTTQMIFSALFIISLLIILIALTP